MKNIKCLFVIFISLFLFNSCSNDDDNDAPVCPEIESISMKINGELKQFEYAGRGIDLNTDTQGHTLSLQIFSGVFSPYQDSHAISFKLPYKKTGNNIIEQFDYLRVDNGSSYEGDFVLQELQSTVNVNTNTCFSATFSGQATIDGNEVVITEGSIKLIYSEPFEN